MTATGVLVVTARSGRTWVGPRPAPLVLLRAMREVRSLGRIVCLNFTDGVLDFLPDVEVVTLPPPTFATQVFAKIDALDLDDAVACCFAETPLLDPAAIERCTEAVLAGALAAQTVRDTAAWVPNADGLMPAAATTAPAPVFGCRAFRRAVRTKTDWFVFPAGLTVTTFVPVHVGHKQALSLADPGDLELIQALEFAGRI